MQHRRVRRRRADSRRKLRSERLEDRRLLAILTVTDLRDDTLANLRGDGQLSLREAIEAANTDASVDGSVAGSGADEIRFASGLAGTISLLGSRLAVTDELTLTGPSVAPGAELLEISGENTVQVLFVGSTRLTIDRLSLDSGRGLTGGNIENQGDLLIRGSTLFSGWGQIDGGGIHNTGTATIIDSTFWGNGTSRHGGAIYNAGTLALINSTIARSRAHSSGGGIHNATGTVTVINSTIAESRADANGLGNGDGGGIWTGSDPAAKTSLYNTLVVGNDAGFINFQHDSDIAGKNLESGSANNLISDPMSAGGLAEGVDGNLLGDGSGNLLGIFSFVDYPPTPNGGYTPTYRPQPGSRAIDAGNNLFATTLGDDGIPGTGDANESALATDQRGAPFVRGFGTTVDIGAVEHQTVPASLLVVTTTADHVDYADADVSLREAINSAGGSAGDDIITFGGPVFTDATPDIIALQHGQLGVFDPSSLTIRGTGSDALSIDAQDQSRVIYFEAFYGELHVENITITGGQTPYYGAGIQFRDGNALTITDSVISGNTVSGDFGYGGGIYSTSNVAVTRSRISDNSAPGSGGGLYSRDFDYETTITESVITGNTAGGGGGGVYAGLLAITDSTISGNSASGRGGGTLGFYAKVTRSTISGNRSATDGGGVAAYSDAEVSSSTITGNTADGRGGGIYAGANLVVSQSTIYRNTAGGDGGGIVSPWNGDVTLINSTVSGNRSNTGRGGGLFFDDGAARLIHSTVTGNTAGGVGGGIGNLNDGFGESLTVHNSIIAGNQDDGTAPEFVPPDNPTVNLKVLSSLIGVNTGTTLPESQTAHPGTGNVVGSSAAAIDPMLGFLDVSGGVTGTQRLLPASPAIDAGDPLLAVGPGPDGISGNSDDTPLTSDQRGAPFVRSAGAGIDMGAYERQTVDPALFVVTTTADTWDYGDSEVSLREAINSANGSVGDDTVTFGGPVFGDSSADTIALQLGQLSITSSDSLAIEGPGRDLLTIDAQRRSRVMYFNDQGDLTLRGVTITGGQTVVGSVDGNGGGIQFFSEGTLTIHDSHVSGNTAGNAGSSGGGIYGLGDTVVLGSTIAGNQATLNGGGLYARGVVTISDSTITGNTADSQGGGIWSGYGLTLSNSDLSDNSADLDGGGAILNLGDVTVLRSTLTGNTAGRDGGGLHGAYDVTLLNSTISGNTAGRDGGGVYSLYAGDLTLVNSSVSGNTADSRGGGLFFYNSAARIISSTVVDNVAAGAGGGIGNPGGGLNESLTVHNSIIAGNRDDGTAPEFAPSNPQTSLEVLSSLIGDNAGTGLNESQTADPITGNLVGSTLGGGVILARLGPLADHGGPTPTHAPVLGSPAIDAGNPLLLPLDDHDLDGDENVSETLPMDQRGEDRIQGLGLDIGAFERAGFDYGDAPDPYATKLPTGASHVASGPRLGASRDTEVDGQPTANADGDGSDEDGVVFGEIYSAASIAAFNVLLENAASAFVDAWIDFDRDGVWEASEKIVDSVEVTNTLQTLNYNLPSGLTSGDTYARVRLSSVGGLDPTGPAADGEVEDYLVTIDPPPQIESVVINGGADQRSSIDRVTVNFDRIVAIDQTSGDPFRIVNTDTNDSVTDVPVISEVNGKTVVELSFAPGASVTSFGSLVDGNYHLTIDATLIHRLGIALDGDGDGTAGGNHIYGDQATDEFYRKYGDHNGNGTVELFDFAAFRSTFGKSSADPQFVSALDSNGDDRIDLFDFAAFRANFGT